MEILQQKKAELLSAGSVEKKDVVGRDLLTLLLKANMATDIPESQQLSDEDVLARTSPSFPKLVAFNILTNIVMLQRSPRTFAWDAYTCCLSV